MASEADGIYRRTENHRAQVEYLEEQVSQALAQVRDLDSQVAALSQALGEQAAGKAAWQARAGRLEGTLRSLEVDKEVLDAHGFSAPRPSPSRLLEVVRAAVEDIEADRAWQQHQPKNWNETEYNKDDELYERRRSANKRLIDAVERLTPEERQALGEGE